MAKTYEITQLIENGPLIQTQMLVLVLPPQKPIRFGYTFMDLTINETIQYQLLLMFK